MKISTRVHFLVLFVTYLNLISFCQNGSVVIIDNSTNANPTNQSAVSNYLGCKNWSNGVCRQCSTGYYFDNQKVCQQIDPLCKQFNQQAGQCEVCYQGYIVIDGQCSLNQSNNNTDSGCRRFDANNKCVQCSQRWYFNQNGNCQKVDDNCKTWSNAGLCQSCYNGYDLNQGTCTLKANDQATSDPLCKTWNGSICTECSYRAFFSQNHICQEVSPNCNTWDKLSGLCLTCYQGFTLQNGDCAASNDANQLDPLCKKFDWKNKVCVECSQRSFKNQQGVCTQVSPLCKTYNQLTCTSCYGGYQLRNGQCLASNQSDNSSVTDLGCARWDWGTKKCLQCSTRYYFNNQGVCTQVSDTCNTFNSATGACTSCYSGYTLNGNTCVVSQGNNTNNNTNPTTDSNCRNFDKQSNRCLQCSYRYYLGVNGLCLQVSDQCQTWNSNNGYCTSCYQGYQLSQGACTQGGNGSNALDQNCAKYDQNQKRCLQCATRYYLTQNGVCNAVSSQCQTWSNTNGLCTSCYQGYTLLNGACNLQPTNVIPEGCSSYNSQTNLCQSCQTNYCLTQNSLCIAKPSNCQTCEYRGGCAKCINGYQLLNGLCVQSTNSRCIQYQGNQCVQCEQNSILFDGICITYEELRRLLGNSLGSNGGNVGNSSQEATNTTDSNTPA